MKRLQIILLFSLITMNSSPQISILKGKIQQVIEYKNADIGVAVLDLSNGDTIAIHGERHYPMQSVFKFPIALKVLHNVDKGKINLVDSILIRAKDLKKDTWSPIREMHPNGNFYMSFANIIYYTIAQSDNNGCDILLRFAGGTISVNNYLRSIGIKNITILRSEAEQHKNFNAQFYNFATPNEAINLLQKFYENTLLKPYTQDFLMTTMTKTSTGSIKKKIPKNIQVAHKTGSAFDKAKGRFVTNDIGIMTFPNKHAIAYAIFIMNSKETPETNYDIIADIGKVLAENYK